MEEPGDLVALGEEGSSKWVAVGGEWEQTTQGVITPPENLVDENLAFYTPKVWQDFEAEFEFRWDIVWTTAALLFRAVDARHSYAVDFPVVGQHYRGEPGPQWGEVLSRFTHVPTR